MNMLTSKQRAQLRRLANPLPVLLIIGKDGITDGVERQLEQLLNDKELVKIKLLETAFLTPKTASEALCAALQAEPVQCIGTKLVLYRPSPDPDKRQIVLEGEKKKG
jgi:RNA-binding protein